MPFNGVGVFTRVYQWEQDAANGIFVDATRTDTDSNDIASGLTNCVTRDGQSPWLANLPAGGFKITGLANGTNSTDSVNYGQVFNNPTFTGTATFAALTVTPGIVNLDGASSVTVPTVAFGDNSTNAASTAFVQATAFSSALPAQAGNAGKFVTTNGTTASWTDTFTIPITFNSSATVSFGAAVTLASKIDEAKGANIASAATINLTTATGNLIHITGTTTITAITIPSGAERTLVFDGILTLTHNATTLILPTGANITTAVGDVAKVRGDGSGNARVVSYERANGRALAVTPPALILLATLTPTAAANVESLSVFTSAYDAYKIVFDGLLPATAAAIRMRFANAGVVDTASNYLGAVTASPTDVFFGSSNNTDSAGTGITGIIEIANTNVGTSAIKAGFWSTYSTRVAATTWDGIDVAIGYNGGAVSGFRFFWSTGANFQATGKIYVYGYANT